jgi:lambda family phage portal protein
MTATRLDRLIAQVSPRWATNRLRSRIQFQAASGYDAARRDRPSTRNWSMIPATADQDTLPGLDNMRAASREMVRNQPLAGGAISTVVTNVVGTGLRMSAQVDRPALASLAGVSDEAASAFEAAAEREWRLFCRRENCDAAGRLSFSGMQELAFRSVLESGDAFAAVVASDAGRPFDFRIQLIEADRVCNPGRKPDAERLAGGVETATSGRALAFHVADLSRTTGQQKSWRRLAAWGDDGTPRVLHLMHQRRIDQSRGVPYLAPVMTKLKELDRYSEAEITAAVLNACLAIMSTSPTGQSPLQLEAAGAGGGTAGGLQRADITFEPGMVLEGFMPGEEIKGMPAERPATGFDPFVQAILRQVGVALELPFELLIKHFTASYSAARAALLQAWGFFRVRRAWLAEAFCQPTYELVIQNAVLRGRIAAPGFLDDPMMRAAWCGARWVGPSPGQIDPLKEVNAAEKRLALMLSTRTRETAELTGDDWEAVAAELASEAEYLDRLGLELPVMESDAPPPAMTDPADANEDDSGDPAQQEAA